MVQHCCSQHLVKYGSNFKRKQINILNLRYCYPLLEILGLAGFVAQGPLVLLLRSADMEVIKEVNTLPTQMEHSYCETENMVRMNRTQWQKCKKNVNEREL